MSAAENLRAAAELAFDGRIIAEAKLHRLRAGDGLSRKETPT